MLNQTLQLKHWHNPNIKTNIDRYALMGFVVAVSFRHVRLFSLKPFYFSMVVVRKNVKLWSWILYVYSSILDYLYLRSGHGMGRRGKLENLVSLSCE
jgi:hypothetical protein